MISDLGMAIRTHPAIRVTNEMRLVMVNFSRRNITPMIITKSGLDPSSNLETSPKLHQIESKETGFCKRNFKY